MASPFPYAFPTRDLSTLNAEGGLYLRCFW